MTQGKKILFYTTISVLLLYFGITGLVQARTFLIPFTTAVILALLVLPLSQKMEKGFINRGWASFLNTILLLLVSWGFMALISFQVKNVVDDWPEIRETMEPKIAQAKSFILEHTPINEEDLSPSQENGSSISLPGPSSGAGQRAAGIFGAVFGFMGDYLLCFIYIFFLLNYRSRFRRFLLKLFPDSKRKRINTVISNSAVVTQKYLIGKIFLIGLLAVLYAIGLGISGVNNFILVSVLAALFSIIPYIGNIIGFGMAMIFGYLVSGETGVLIGILLTFSIAQFVESYILEPYIVGDQVDLHPFFVILSVIVGGMIWGVMGMILAIPILAIINVVLVNIRSLKPFGFLISQEEDSED